MPHLSVALEKGAARFGLAVPATLIAFIGVGFAGLAVDLGLFTVLERVMWFGFARAISLPAATIVTWSLNRRFTFSATGRKAHHEALRYGAVTVVAQSVNYGVMLLLAGLAPGVPHVVDAFVGAVVATAFSYTGQRFFTFAPARKPE